MRAKLRALHWRNLPIRWKLYISVLFISVLILVSNFILYNQVNNLIRRMDEVYSSNVNLTELSDTLGKLQQYLYRYLEVRDYDSLSGYYRTAEEYRNMYEQFPETVSNNPVRVQEKNIRCMSDRFLSYTDEAVTAKRGMNIERYRRLYNEAMRLYGFIGDEISVLNEQQFQNNVSSYTTLQKVLQYLERSSIIVMAAIAALGVWIVGQLTFGIVAPIRNLAKSAVLVGEGDFQQKVEPVDSDDEIGVVVNTFNDMVDSLNNYVIRMRESAEKEQELTERQLRTQANLKEAQLKYLQAQINPHFLFNSLNAGVQLAEMEDDEKTAVFLEHMATFFRYNVKKGEEDAAIGEELETVENYMYILNVRFAGEIGFETDVDESVLQYRMPSMILQPIVENSVQHGIKGMESGGKISLTIASDAARNRVRITVKDNGKGMSEEELRRVFEELSAEETGREKSGRDESGSEQQFAQGEPGQDGIAQNREDMNRTDAGAGIGLRNVIARLRLYYGEEAAAAQEDEAEELIRILSEPGQGTEVILSLPEKGAES